MKEKLNFTENSDVYQLGTFKAFGKQTCPSCRDYSYKEYWIIN